jgi:hypothetical protein
MNINNILSGFYIYLKGQNFINENYVIICQDIRVENYFMVKFLVYLNDLLLDGNIDYYEAQYHFSKVKRSHIDIMLKLNNEETYFIELKHFSVSQVRNKTRNLRFYTNNSNAGHKLGILNDCKKFDILREHHEFKKGSTICLAIMTDMPKIEELKLMEERFSIYSKNILNGWNLIYPIPKNEQSAIGMFALQK